MSTEQETPEVSEEEVERRFKSIVQRSLQAARSLQDAAKAAGFSPLETVLGMQLSTIYLISENERLAAGYKAMMGPLYDIARAVGIPDFEPAQPVSNMDKLGDHLNGYVVESIHAVNASFEMGPINLSEGARAVITAERVVRCLAQYSAKDWGGFLSEEEKARNDENVERGKGTIFAIYLLDEKKPREPENTFYVITQPDRSETKVLMASEY